MHTCPRDRIRMLIFLLVVYFSWQHTTQAAPLNGRTSLLETDPYSCPDKRSLFDVVWGCASTMFICTWVAIHPNLPPPRERIWRTLGRRLKLMFWTLVAPELMLTWALRQWSAARKVEKTYNERGWTTTHGFFLTMGGFYLCKGDESLGTLSFDMLQELDQAGDIVFPVISTEDIDDRSKGDVLAKGIAILQTTWFIIQCIARGAQGLTITELELVTLALASLNATIYFFWWHKPLDVQSRVPVLLKPDSTFMHQPRLKRAEVIVNEETGNQELADTLANQREGSAISAGLFARWMPPAIREEKANFRKFVAKIQRRWRKDAYNSNHSLILVILWSILTLPILLVVLPMIALFGDKRDSQTIKPGAERVPTFYSPALTVSEERILTCVLVSVAMIFGGLHCIGWLLSFPTRQEKILWDVASVTITAIPIIVLFLEFASLEHRIDEIQSGAQRTRSFDKILDAGAYGFVLFCIAGIFLYLPTRLCLLVEAIISLRALPPDAYVDIDWTRFIPHYR